MSRKNEIIGKEVSERKGLWASVRRAEPIQEIRRLMRKKEILNRDMAIRLGISEASVSRLLKGNQNMQIDTLHMLADAIEEPLRITFGEENIECEYFSDHSQEFMSSDFVDFVGDETTNVTQLDAYRRSRVPSYNSFELECA